MLAKFEIGIAHSEPCESHAPLVAIAQVDAVHRQLANVPAVEPKTCQPTPLAELAPKLAQAYLQASTAHRFTDVRAPWWVTDGTPMMLVMYSAKDRLILPAELRTVRSTRDHRSVTIGHWWQPFRRRWRRVWFLGYDQADYALARQMRIDLVRLHCEYESLRIILRHVACGLLLPARRSELSSRLQRYLSDAITTVTELRSARRSVICETSCRLVGAAAAEVLEEDTTSLVADLELQLDKLDVRPNIRRKVRDYAAEEDRPESYGHAPALTLPASRCVILFLAANPSGTNRLHLDEECAGIEREVSMTAAREDFELRSKWAVTVDELMRHLANLGPTIIHFSGHGHGIPDAGGQYPSGSSLRDIEAEASAGIYLQDEHRRPQYVSAHALTKMIASAARSARVVVLNACFSDALAESLCSVVDCVVGMRGAVDDDTARSFAVGFYRALGNRSSVANAVAQAVATLAAKQLHGEHLPVCRTREGVDADQVVLSGLDFRRLG